MEPDQSDDTSWYWFLPYMLARIFSSEHRVTLTICLLGSILQLYSVQPTTPIPEVDWDNLQIVETT